MKIAIIPAFNEEETIYQVVKETKKYVDKVIAVDDGSTDRTYEKAREAGADALKHIINMGKGFTLKTGFKAAQKYNPDHIILLDADGQHAPKDIPKLVEQLKGFDIALGVRETSGASAIFRFGNWFLNTLFFVLFRIKVTDTQSGFRAFNKKAVEAIKWKSNGYAVETEMLTQIKKHNLTYTEVSISTTYHNVYKGTTIFDGIKIAFKMLLWKLEE